MNVKTAVILGGGVSSRFYPFNYQNKSLISITGSTLFEMTLSSLKRAGIEKIIVVDDLNGTLAKSLQKKDIEIGIEFISQSNPEGMGEALLLAKEKITENNFFVLSPYHFEIDLFAEEMLKSQKTPEDLVIVTKLDEDSSQFGGVSVRESGVKVHEKSTERFAYRIVSMYLLNETFLKTLERQKKHHYSFEDAISNYKNAEVVLLEVKRDTISLKFPWDMLSVKDYILNNIQSFISEDAKISESARISGSVYIARGVKIMDGAVIDGPAYIGKNSYVGTNAILRSGVILEESTVIGAGMEVKNSLLMKGATTHSGFIGDSIIGEGTKIAAGFITGNVRLDRKEVFATVKKEKINTHRKFLGCIIGPETSIGIHVGIMPGVIIGRNVIIGPSTTVMENIPESTMYYTTFKEIVKR